LFIDQPELYLDPALKNAMANEKWKMIYGKWFVLAG
jgi:hypothetical protein